MRYWLALALLLALSTPVLAVESGQDTCVVDGVVHADCRGGPPATTGSLMCLEGRAGGQTLQGGTASGEDLILESTSHATKGGIDVGISETIPVLVVDEATGRVGISKTAATLEGPADFYLGGRCDNGDPCGDDSECTGICNDTLPVMILRTSKEAVAEGVILTWVGDPTTGLSGSTKRIADIRGLISAADPNPIQGYLGFYTNRGDLIRESVRISSRGLMMVNASGEALFAPVGTVNLRDGGQCDDGTPCLDDSECTGLCTARPVQLHFYHSDTTDNDASAQIAVDCTTLGSGVEDCDWAVGVQENGVMDDRITIDSDAGVTIGSGSTNLITLQTDGTALGEVTLSPLATGGAAECVTADSTGQLDTQACGAGGTPGGSDTQFQYNNGGAFGGASGLVYDDANNIVGVGGAPTSDNNVMDVEGRITFNSAYPGGTSLTGASILGTNAAGETASGGSGADLGMIQTSTGGIRFYIDSNSGSSTADFSVFKDAEVVEAGQVGLLSVREDGNLVVGPHPGGSGSLGMTENASGELAIKLTHQGGTGVNNRMRYETDLAVTNAGLGFEDGFIVFENSSDVTELINQFFAGGSASSMIYQTVSGADRGLIIQTDETMTFILDPTAFLTTSGNRKFFWKSGVVNAMTLTDRAILTLASTETGSAAAELRLGEPQAGGTNYTAFKAQTQAGDVTYALPAADATSNGQQLTSDAAGTLRWEHEVALNRIHLQAAGCNNATAAPILDLPTTNAPTAACAGTDIRRGVLEFVDGGSDKSAYAQVTLPPGFTGAIDADYWWTSSTTTGSVAWCTEIVCVGDSEPNDPAFPGQASSSCISKTVDATTTDMNRSVDTGIAQAGCGANELALLRISRDADDTSTVGDTMAGTAELWNVFLTIREQQ